VRRKITHLSLSFTIQTRTLDSCSDEEVEGEDAAKDFNNLLSQN
jgi:hypothetical protein